MTSTTSETNLSSVLRTLQKEGKLFYYYKFFSAYNPLPVISDHFMITNDKKAVFIEAKQTKEERQEWHNITSMTNQVYYNKELQTEAVKHIYLFAFYKQKRFYIVKKLANLHPRLKSYLTVEDCESKADLKSDNIRDLIEQYLREK